MSSIEIPTPQELNDKFQRWDDILKQPLWYQQVMPTLINWWNNLPKNEESEEIQKQIYQYFAQKLVQDDIYLAIGGPNFDQWRKPIDTAVIHYSDNKPGISWQMLSAIGLLRQYAHDFYKYDDVYGIPTTDNPIWSGHFKDNKQVFYAYHWLVRLDGSSERLLEDKYIGWHAGNRDINFRSVGICLDGDFENSEPPIAAIEGIIEIIREHYPTINSNNVLGHLEVNPRTECPGSLFLSTWKDKVIAQLTNS